MEITQMKGKFEIKKLQGCKNSWKEIFEEVGKLLDITSNWYFHITSDDFDVSDFPEDENDKVSEEYEFSGNANNYSSCFKDYLFYDKNLFCEDENLESFMKNTLLNGVSIVLNYDEAFKDSGYIESELRMEVNIANGKMYTPCTETPYHYSVEKEVYFTDEWFKGHMKYFKPEDVEELNPIKNIQKRIGYLYNDYKFNDIKLNMDGMRSIARVLVSDLKYLSSDLDKKTVNEFKRFARIFLERAKENETMTEFIYRTSSALTIHDFLKEEDRIEENEKIKEDYKNAMTKDPGNNLYDGVHTMSELYFHRMFLFSTICKLASNEGVFCFRSKLHEDGSMLEDFFIVGIRTSSGDYSYHYHVKYWDYFDCCDTLERAPRWDGVAADDLIRLYDLVKDIEKCK